MDVELGWYSQRVTHNHLDVGSNPTASTLGELGEWFMPGRC